MPDVLIRFTQLQYQGRHEVSLGSVILWLIYLGLTSEGKTTILSLQEGNHGNREPWGESTDQDLCSVIVSQ